MSNLDTVDDRSSRASALDQYARTTDAAPRGDVVIPAQMFAAAGDRIVGAQQVAVYRDEARVLTKLKALAAAAGSEWYYRFPVKNRKENRTDWIEGPSIKLANDLARLYGNCDVDIRVMDLGDSWVFYARFTDFETGFSLTRPFQQRKSGSQMGGADDARRLDIAFQIGASKAIRNVVTNALQTFSDFAFEEAKNALVDKIGSDVAAWRKRMGDRLAPHVDIARVEAVVGRKLGEWLAPDIARVIAMMKAVTDGMASLDDTFPPLLKDGAAAEPGAKMDQFAEGEAKATKPARKAVKPASAVPATELPPAEEPADDPDAALPADPRQWSGADLFQHGEAARAAGKSRAEAIPPELRGDEWERQRGVIMAGWDKAAGVEVDDD